eukprot:scaffold6925_cov180-Amphora_coffeaeformis.AAC.1
MSFDNGGGTPTRSPLPDGGSTPTSEPTTETSKPTLTPKPTVSPEPTLAPTVTAQPTTTPFPTLSPKPTNRPTITTQPSISPAPTITPAPTLRPTFTSMPTQQPSTEPTPTLFLENVIFTCTDDGQVALATQPLQEATLIPFDVTYLVESTLFFTNVQSALEARILADAVQGALNCGPGIFATDDAPVVPMQTSPTGESCDPTISTCSIVSTEFSIVVDEDVSPEATAFLGYVKLSQDMESYPASISDVDLVEYLRPLLFPPILGNNQTQPPVGLQGDPGVDSISVSPWTIGAVLAVCLGGATALGVWARNRQRRNEQHMQLLEDMSIGDGQEA